MRTVRALQKKGINYFFLMLTLREMKKILFCVHFLAEKADQEGPAYRYVIPKNVFILINILFIKKYSPDCYESSYASITNK